MARWTAEQIELLRLHYRNKAAVEVAKIVGRPLSSIYKKAQELKLGKSADFFSTLNQNPWNKGLHYIPRDGGTRFKKGIRQGCINHQPIGSLRLHKNYLQQKINDDLPFQQRWQFVHRLVWQKVHGDIPAHLLVCFKPGMKTIVLEEITIDRLELIPKTEMMQKNSLHNYPKELVELINLRGRITRKINQKEEK